MRCSYDKWTPTDIPSFVSSNSGFSIQPCDWRAYGNQAEKSQSWLVFHGPHCTNFKHCSQHGNSRYSQTVSLGFFLFGVIFWPWDMGLFNTFMVTKLAIWINGVYEHEVFVSPTYGHWARKTVNQWIYLTSAQIRTVSLTTFGSSWRSITYLGPMPISALKLHQPLVGCWWLFLALNRDYKERLAVHEWMISGSRVRGFSQRTKPVVWGVSSLLF